MDENQEVNSTVSVAERTPYLKEMKDRFERSFDSREYCDYKNRNISENIKKTEDIVLTCYFVGVPDPQRGQWKPNFNDCKALIDSMNGQKIVIINDCFDNIEVPDNVELVKVKATANPYFQRWISYFQYLRDNPQVRNVFCVDATDVEMYINPFEYIDPNKIYVGSEQTQLYNNWMITNHRVNFLITFFRSNAKNTLLNAGILGGSREKVLEYIHSINKIYFDQKKNVGNGDMGVFNYVGYSFFRDSLVTGKNIHTKFKSFEKPNGISWWKHK